MVTPLHDPNWRKWCVEGAEIHYVFTDYQAEGFHEYLKRGWCRLEMFFNAYIPMRASRAKYLGGELKRIMVEENRRPHLLFGTREKELGKMPVILRNLTDEEFETFHPGQGLLTDGSDSDIIKAYVEELVKINRRLWVCKD
jgi:hypothetical protein